MAKYNIFKLPYIDDIRLSDSVSAVDPEFHRDLDKYLDKMLSHLTYPMTKSTSQLTGVKDTEIMRVDDTLKNVFFDSSNTGNISQNGRVRTPLVYYADENVRGFGKFWDNLVKPAIEQINNDTGSNYLSDSSDIVEVLNTIPTTAKTYNSLTDQQKRAIISKTNDKKRFIELVKNNITESDDFFFKSGDTAVDNIETRDDNDIVVDSITVDALQPYIDKFRGDYDEEEIKKELSDANSSILKTLYSISAVNGNAKNIISKLEFPFIDGVSAAFYKNKAKEEQTEADKKYQEARSQYGEDSREANEYLKKADYFFSLQQIINATIERAISGEGFREGGYSKKLIPTMVYYLFLENLPVNYNEEDIKGILKSKLESQSFIPNEPKQNKDLSLDTLEFLRSMPEDLSFNNMKMKILDSETFDKGKVTYDKDLNEEDKSFDFDLEPKAAFAMNVKDPLSPIRLRERIPLLSNQKWNEALRKLTYNPEQPLGPDASISRKADSYTSLSSFDVPRLKNKDVGREAVAAANKPVIIDKDEFFKNLKPAELFNDDIKSKVMKLAMQRAGEANIRTSSKDGNFLRDTIDDLFRINPKNLRKRNVYVSDMVFNAVNNAIKGAEDPDERQRILDDVAGYFRYSEDSDGRNRVSFAADTSSRKANVAKGLRYEHVVPMKVMADIIGDLYVAYKESSEDGELSPEMENNFYDTAKGIVEALYTIAYVDSSREDEILTGLGYLDSVASGLNNSDVIDAVERKLENRGKLSDADQKKISNFIYDRYNRAGIKLHNVEDWFGGEREKKLSFTNKEMTKHATADKDLNENIKKSITNLLFGY